MTFLEKVAGAAERIAAWPDWKKKLYRESCVHPDNNMIIGSTISIEEFSKSLGKWEYRQTTHRRKLK